MDDESATADRRILLARNFLLNISTHDSVNLYYRDLPAPEHSQKLNSSPDKGTYVDTDEVLSASDLEPQPRLLHEDPSLFLQRNPPRASYTFHPSCVVKSNAKTPGWCPHLPSVIYSVLPYVSARISKPRDPSAPSATDSESNEEDHRHQKPKAISYQRCLAKSSPYAQVTELYAYLHAPPKKHTTTLMASYASTVIRCERREKTKRESNQKFKEEFPNARITLSKLHSLKRQIAQMAADVNLEFVTLAMALLYFERLAISGLVNKTNRRLYACICLSLAHKFLDQESKDFAAFYERLEHHFHIDPKQIRSNEFYVYADLNFDLIVPEEQLIAYHTGLTNKLAYPPFDNRLVWRIHTQDARPKKDTHQSS